MFSPVLLDAFSIFVGTASYFEGASGGAGPPRACITGIPTLDLS
jgi:hypothetical protein